MGNAAERRKTVKLKHPNPLFERWIVEWRDSAEEHKSKMQNTFSKALKSLRSYPLPLESGRDCKILQGFGDRLCQMLDRKLEEYSSAGENPDNLSCQSQLDANNKLVPKLRRPENASPKSSPDPKKARKAYSPIHRSGGYAILVALYKTSLLPDYKGFMLKDDIIKEGQQLCDKSFTDPDSGTFYTSWSSMKRLIDKNLVLKQNRPAKYILSDEGLLLAHKLYRKSLDDEREGKQQNKAQKNIFSQETCTSETVSNQSYSRTNSDITESLIETVDVNEVPNSNGAEKIKEKLRQKTSPSSGVEDQTIILAPNTFDIFLVVDNKETSGNNKEVHEDVILAELTYRKVQFEVKHLKVGDYTWLCRDRASKTELVLPYIVERKRMDDFGSSIKDGRYHEQKFRLKQCGIQNVIYLVESYGDNMHTGLPLSTLFQAATNTMVHDNFQLKFTDSTKETALYLSCMTKILQNKFMSKTIMSCQKINLEKSSLEDDLVPLLTFKEFSQIGSVHKKFTARQMFIRQLVQLKGLSVEKAIAIVDRYPTPNLLKLAYNESLGDKGEKLLASIKFGKSDKNIGPAISKILYQLYK